MDVLHKYKATKTNFVDQQRVTKILIAIDLKNQVCAYTLQQIKN
jgi:hypothetical protein